MYEFKEFTIYRNVSIYAAGSPATGKVYRVNESNKTFECLTCCKRFIDEICRGPLKIRVLFNNPENGNSVTIKPFDMEVPAALWSFMGEYERKEYCFRSFFSSHDLEYKEMYKEVE